MISGILGGRGQEEGRDWKSDDQMKMIREGQEEDEKLKAVTKMNTKRKKRWREHTAATV